MNFHASPADIDGHGRDVTAIGQELADGVSRGRSVRLTTPGLTTGPAFDAFRDAWLGQGLTISTTLDENGFSQSKGAIDHDENEVAKRAGFDAIRPPK